MRIGSRLTPGAPGFRCSEGVTKRTCPGTRLRNESVTSALAEPVPDAAHRLERMAAEGPIDLLAQVADVDVDDVRVALEGDVPGRVQKLDARERLARPAHEDLEQDELLRRQVE